MYKVRETVLPIYINGQCPIIKTCSDVTLNLSSKDSSKSIMSDKKILALRRNSLDHVLPRVHIHISQRLSIFTPFYSFPSRQYIETNLMEKQTLRESRTCLLYNKSPRLRPLHHSGRYSLLTNVMIH